MILQLHRLCSTSNRLLLLQSSIRNVGRFRSAQQWTVKHRISIKPSRNDSRNNHFSPFFLLSGALVTAKGLANQFDSTNGKLIDLERPIELKTAIQSETGSFTWKKLWHLIKPNWIYLISSILSSFVVAFLNIGIPKLLGQITDVVSHAVASGDEMTYDAFIEHVTPSASRLLSLYLLQGLFTFTTIACLSTLGERIAGLLRTRLFSTILIQDAEFFDRHRSGELLSRLTNDVQEFKSSFKLCISQGLRSITQVIGCAISLYLTSPELALGMLLIVPGFVGIGSLLGALLRQGSRACQHQQALCAATAGEALTNVRVVKMFAMEGSEQRLFEKQSHECERLNCRLGIGIGIFQALTNVALNSLIGCTLLVGGMLVADSKIQPGDLMSFLVASQIIQRSLTSLSLMFGQFVKCTAAGQRIFSYLELQPKLISTQNRQCDPLVGDISFQKISFAYPTRPTQRIFNDFSFHIPPNKVVALCGPSGSGKSTLGLLMERFYDVNDGTVYIDGVDVRELDLRWLRGRAIGFINQEPTLFATSIMENIRYARPEATDQEVIAAAKAANAHQFICSFPHGYNTVTGERGLSISGGQRQRIAIARAILKDPAILVLDEATSALDSESEKIISQSLEQMMKGRTVLIIAHRLSTIQNADVIAVMNDGQIVEQGTHRELLKKRGLYWNLVQQQFGNENK